jgi:hypothetical protein
MSSLSIHLNCMRVEALDLSAKESASSDRRAARIRSARHPADEHSVFFDDRRRVFQSDCLRKSEWGELLGMAVEPRASLFFRRAGIKIDSALQEVNLLNAQFAKRFRSSPTISA